MYNLLGPIVADPQVAVLSTNKVCSSQLDIVLTSFQTSFHMQLSRRLRPDIIADTDLGPVPQPSFFYFQCDGAHVFVRLQSNGSSLQGHVFGVTTRRSSFPRELRPFGIRAGGERRSMLGAERSWLGGLRRL